jgi:hypothetical protein
MERIYALMLPTNGIRQTVPGVEACAHASSFKGGGESHADLKREQHRASGLDHEGVVIVGRAGPSQAGIGAPHKKVSTAGTRGN